MILIQFPFSLNPGDFDAKPDRALRLFIEMFRDETDDLFPINCRKGSGDVHACFLPRKIRNDVFFNTEEIQSCLPVIFGVPGQPARHGKNFDDMTGCHFVSDLKSLAAVRGCAFEWEVKPAACMIPTVSRGLSPQPILRKTPCESGVQKHAKNRRITAVWL